MIEMDPVKKEANALPSGQRTKKKGGKRASRQRVKEYPYTKEELISYLMRKQEELGRRPKKSDMPDDIKQYYRILFGKWCYALEEAGLSVPSEQTLERRRRQKMRHRR